MKSEILILDKLPALRNFLISDGDEPAIDTHLEALRKSYIELGLQIQYASGDPREKNTIARIRDAADSIGYLYDMLEPIRLELREYLSSAKAVEE